MASRIISWLRIGTSAFILALRARFGYNFEPMTITDRNNMAEIRTLHAISGVYVVDLVAYGDERGQFLETFRKEWFPQRTWHVIQTNRSDSRAGVIRGLHYHRAQVDYWYVARGKIRAALADIRVGSPTRGSSTTIEMGGERQVGLYIPVGVAHGFAALDDATLTYLVDNYYDSSDEFGVAWNDPELGIDWGVADPLLSERDRANPQLAQIPASQRPIFEPAGS
jgi:dTDP-4-dehydrorhamnose 3,5-epimerase